ncbi:transcriptional repressor, CopY family [Emticicia oligotrophica DSM 17448]|uniref:Transcriptional repressor, CopY family n=1 Tax=Emticicia oligotrophica (strain DSM 17448 / CIP 109782 / MTCC 6937 / GPTSA100-15) TaxID=929562 RepID=A0ABM5N363_EMTOG|nr:MULTISPECIES: BlaI/MecI/CopY family transcriptional regulator [Emticicia]AFK03891.1 transcriptional repressor, CopY family [Emticicia oligotrophica DSM 17448]
MENSALIKPTESELEILQILWQLGKGTVRQVNDELSKTREVGYTTTLKLMQIMHDKHIVNRTEEGRYHLYEAAIGEEETQQLLLDKFVDATFRGSAMKLVMQALGHQEVSLDELDEIKKLIAQKEQNLGN